MVVRLTPILFASVYIEMFLSSISLISVFLFNEHFGVLSFVGIVLVLGSIVLMNTKGKEESAAPSGA